MEIHYRFTDRALAKLTRVQIGSRYDILSPKTPPKCILDILGIGRKIEWKCVMSQGSSFNVFDKI
jgi:hypothetical protein